jgi:hypothetical protein
VAQPPRLCAFSHFSIYHVRVRDFGSPNHEITDRQTTPLPGTWVHVSTAILPVDFVISRELFSAYTGKEGDPTYMKSSDGSSNKREVAEA